MKEIKIQDVLGLIEGKILCGDANSVIRNASNDTRTLEKGETYFALVGEKANGAIYCKNAIEKGATVCVIQDYEFTKEELEEFGKKATIVKVANAEDALVKIAAYKRNLYDIEVVGITGSVGKTSTKDVVAHVLEQKFKVQKTKGNQNNRIGLPLTIMGLDDHDVLVTEMGMNHLGEIEELSKIARPTLSLITNVGTSHIGYLGSRENILKAKLEILEGMKEPKIIINNDNDLLNKWAKEEKNVEKITYGIKEPSDYVAENVVMKEDGNTFDVTINQKNYKFETKKAGEPFVLNSLAAIAVGNYYGIEIEKIQKAIKEVEITKNRMDIENTDDYCIIKDFYNASFESIKPSLEYLAGLNGGNKIAVLGDIKEVGDFSQEIHTNVGTEVAKNKIDYLITVGKEAKYIAEGAMDAGMDPDRVFAYKTNIQATMRLKEIAQKGDKILIKASNSMKFGEIYEGLLRKVRVAVVVGGMSSEHPISLLSGQSILRNIDKNKYDVKVVYIAKNSLVYEYTGSADNLPNEDLNDLRQELNLIDAIKEQDVVFPVLHGQFGEDGSIQGVFEMIEKPYVGCGVFASSSCMDKEYTKKLVAQEGIPVAKAVIVNKLKHSYIIGNETENKYDINTLVENIEKEIDYPLFVKPSREGSSFGVTKAENREGLITSIKEAEKFDTKILVEEEIKGRELECGVLGNLDVISSEVGEVKSAETFYTFDAKYNNSESKTLIPAPIDESVRNQIKKYSERAFKAIEGTGLARVDFFLSREGKVILNEINTLPGFTKISMYPKLFEAAGIEYSKLIDELIKLAIDR